VLITQHERFVRAGPPRCFFGRGSGLRYVYEAKRYEQGSYLHGACNDFGYGSGVVDQDARMSPDPNSPKTQTRAFKVAQFVWEQELAHGERSP
jgi:hypothetical protein